MTYAPQHKDVYYQKLTDIIAIFWEFHKSRLGKDGWEFTTAPLFPAFNPDDGLRKHSESSQYKVCADFYSTTKSIIRISLLQFYDAVSLQIPNTFTPEMSQFITDYTRELWKQALNFHLYEISKKGSDDDVSIHMRRGLGTAFKTMTHLNAMHLAGNTPRQALILSKCNLRHIKALMDALGVDRDDPFYAPLPDTRIVDNSPDGLNMGMLRKFGYGHGNGDTFGCPAGIPPSQETKTFLASLGIHVRGTVLTELATMFEAEFDAHVRQWYKRLTPEQKRCIDMNEYNVLEGVVLYEARQRAEGRCPFGHGKER